MAQKKRENCNHGVFSHTPNLECPTSDGPLVAHLTEVAAGAEKQSFIDRTIIALFARGYPQEKLFERAELLWRLREENRKR